MKKLVSLMILVGLSGCGARFKPGDCYSFNYSSCKEVKWKDGVEVECKGGSKPYVNVVLDIKNREYHTQFVALYSYFPPIIWDEESNLFEDYVVKSSVQCPQVLKDAYAKYNSK